MKKRPRMPFPAIFSQIDSAMKTHLSNGSHILDSSLPAMTIVAQGRRVISRPIPIAGTDTNLVIRGNYDSLVAFDDDALGVVDWKTTRVRPDLVAKYGRSLHAYAYAIEHPAENAARRIGRLGLGVFEPNHFSFGKHAYFTKVSAVLSDSVQQECNSGALLVSSRRAAGGVH
jgi:hypothetical protein